MDIIPPTYTTDEVLEMACTLDTQGRAILAEVVMEEKGRYCLNDLYRIEQLYRILILLEK